MYTSTEGESKLLITPTKRTVHADPGTLDCEKLSRAEWMYAASKRRSVVLEGFEAKLGGLVTKLGTQSNAELQVLERNASQIAE